MRASKDLLAARVQLQEELARQRQTAANEEIALQSALTTLKDKHLEATDMLVRAAGKHAAESLSAVRVACAARRRRSARRRGVGGENRQGGAVDGQGEKPSSPNSTGGSWPRV